LSALSYLSFPIAATSEKYGVEEYPALLGNPLPAHIVMFKLNMKKSNATIFRNMRF
jgi:hypothetical protein